MQKLPRVYRHYMEWEEISHNMWGTVTNKKKYLKKAIEFTSDHRLYGRFMIKVVDEWPVSCENALTDYSLNRNAWIGHAACALAMGCPEDIVREAWKELSYEQQSLANNEARRAIREWEYAYRKNKGIPTEMGSEVLF